MQQQIDLLNQELRDAKREAEKGIAEAKAFQAESKALNGRLETQLVETKKLTSEIQRTAARAAQIADNIRVEERARKRRICPDPSRRSERLRKRLSRGMDITCGSASRPIQEPFSSRNERFPHRPHWKCPVFAISMWCFCKPSRPMSPGSRSKPTLKNSSKVDGSCPSMQRKLPTSNAASSRDEQIRFCIEQAVKGFRFFLASMLAALFCTTLFTAMPDSFSEGPRSHRLNCPVISRPSQPGRLDLLRSWFRKAIS